jgi:hypothetical protein
MDAAAAGIQEDTTPVGLIAKDNPAFFCIGPVDLGGRYLEVPGQAKGLVGSDPDGLVVAAGAADLALERKRAVPLQVENERGGNPGLVHFCFYETIIPRSSLKIGRSGVESYYRQSRLSIEELGV